MDAHYFEDAQQEYIDAVYRVRQLEGSGDSVALGLAKREAMRLEVKVQNMRYALYTNRDIYAIK